MAVTRKQQPDVQQEKQPGPLPGGPGGGVQKQKPDQTPGETVERPQPPKCDCKTTAEVYTQIGSLPPVQGRALRIRVVIESEVTCDEGTPDHCYYRYVATADVQRFRPRQGIRPATWEAFAQRNAFIQSFTVVDDVNKTERPDRIDQPRLEMGEWFPRAPQKEKTRVTLELAGSVRGGWRTTINRDLELCVPKLEKPKCP